MHLTSLSKLLTPPRICHRRSCRLRDEHYEHGIQALTRQINDLRLHSLAGQAIGVSSSSKNSPIHVLAGTQETKCISNLESTDVLGFKNDAQTAFMCSSPNTRFRKPTQPSLSRSVLPFRRAIRKNNKVVETFFGTFCMSSRTNLLLSNHSEDTERSEEGDCFEYENIFSLIPPSWLAQFGFTYGLSGCISQSPLSGPTVSLDVVRSVPDDAVIFDLCRNGNVACIQALLSRGQASARDVDSQGRTPLYVSSISCFKFHAILYRLFQKHCSIFFLIIPSMS